MQYQEQEFSILDMRKENEGVWHREFEKIEGGPITQCLVLITILKKRELVSPQEALSFKKFALNNEKKSGLVIQSFCSHKSLQNFRKDMRGQLGMPRVQRRDSTCYSSPILRSNSILMAKAAECLLSQDRILEVPELDLQENSIMKRRLSQQLRQKKLLSHQESLAKYENVLFTPRKQDQPATFSLMCQRVVSQKYSSERHLYKNRESSGMTMSTQPSSSAGTREKKQEGHRL